MTGGHCENNATYMRCDDGLHHHTSHITHAHARTYVSCLPLDRPLRTGLHGQPNPPPDRLIHCVCDQLGNCSVPVLRRLGSSSSSSSRDLDVDGSSHEHLHIAFFVFSFFLVCCISLYLYVCMYCIFFATTSW